MTLADPAPSATQMHVVGPGLIPGPDDSIIRAAETFGTPCYVYDGEILAQQFFGIRRRLHERVDIYFSMKANPNISIMGLLHTFGARAEVSSAIELATARAAGVPANEILFLGPGKSSEEIRECLKEGIRALICEAFDELDRIDDIARELGIIARVVLRVNPSFEVKGSALTMGGKPRQFGIDQEQLSGVQGLIGEHANLRIMGVQAYMGTRILSAEAVIENTARVLDLAESLSGTLNFPLELVDVGGGLGVAYFSGENDLDIQVVTDGINPLISAFVSRHPDVEIAMELGRYLVATCGTYVTRVRSTKLSRGERFAVTDGGTNHHMAAIGIGSIGKRNFPIRRIGGGDAQATASWNVTGPLCTPNDTIGRAVQLSADLSVGDLVAVERSGAYGATASPVHFLSHGYPAEVLLVDGEPFLVRRRDRTEDLLSNQILYPFDQAGTSA